MDRARRDEYAARHPSFKRGLEKLERADEVRTEEEVRRPAISPRAIARASPSHRCVNQRVGAADQSALGASVTQSSR